MMTTGTLPNNLILIIIVYVYVDYLYIIRQGPGHAKKLKKLKVMIMGSI